jgi:hypothetical protein
MKVLDNVLEIGTVTPMSKTETHIEVNRYGNVYKVTSEISEVAITEIKVGDRILEEAGWSSHGMKAAEWYMVDEGDNAENLRDYYGDTVTIARQIKKAQIA